MPLATAIYKVTRDKGDVTYNGLTVKMEESVQQLRLYCAWVEGLQATIEALETSNEALQSSNEELMAAHEGLQSTNEELHSVNEALHTVNAEYHGKIQELTELYADIDNLLRSTEPCASQIWVELSAMIDKLRQVPAYRWSF